MSQEFLDGIAVDLDAFLADFGEPLSHTPAGGGIATPFTGTFDADSKALNLGTGTIDNLGPQVLFKTSALPGIKQRDTITRGSTVYTITSVQPDGTGMSIAILKL